jgi:hypothetical protein
MTRFAQAPAPLLDAHPATAPVDHHTRLTLTETGLHVLHGRQDHVTLNGVDRWIGGVHLEIGCAWCGCAAASRGRRPGHARSHETGRNVVGTEDAARVYVERRGLDAPAPHLA